MIRLGIENNLYEQDDMLHFGNNTAMINYTARSQIGRAGSWPVEGIAHYEAIYKMVLKEHEDVDAMEMGGPCDMWLFVIDNDDDDDDGGQTLVEHIEATAMITEVNHSMYDWG